MEFEQVEDKFEQFNSMRKQFKVKATLEVEDKLRQFKAMREQFKVKATLDVCL